MDMKEKLIEVFMHLDRHIQNRDEYGICYTSDFVEAVEDVLEMLKNPNNVGDKPSPTATGWISVKDRLPNKDVPVLGMYQRNPFAAFEPTIVEWIGNGWINTNNDLYGTVTHWMPLPQPPKGE